ncbi:MAG TPA: glycosyltransferase family 4 protein [Gemmatimonadaceae bacterium]|nr:glycosyltransferase family 4 protein [Gemmatimonadaceae bacterium]
MPTKLLLVNQHYYPDVASTGQHLTDLAEHLVDDGYSVEVLTGRGRYVAGKVDAPAHEVRNGVSITRLRTTSFGRAKHIGRVIDYLSFYVRVLGALLFGPKRDGVVFLTTPPLLGFLGAIARVVRGQRYGVWSMDLHPDAEVASGMLGEGSLLAKFLEWANATGYRYADFVVDLGPYMKRRIVAKGVAPERMHTVHVWSAKDEIVPTPRESNPLIDELGLRDKFVVMYSGNAGIVHDFGAICEAMRLLKDDPRIYFLFVGDGPRRAEIERYASENGIENFEYRGYFGREQLRYSLSVADVHLLSLRAPFVGISVPGKLYGIMASGRPAIFVGPSECESADTIVDAGCGLVVDAADGSAGERLATVLTELAADSSACEEWGVAGRVSFEGTYERAVNCDHFAQLIGMTWRERKERAPSSVHAPTGDAVLQDA